MAFENLCRTDQAAYSFTRGSSRLTSCKIDISGAVSFHMSQLLLVRKKCFLKRSGVVYQIVKRTRATNGNKVPYPPVGRRNACYIVIVCLK
jgi:hypothetical protein